MGLRVDLAELRSTADDVHQARSDLAEEWDRIRARARALFERGWTGTAANSYEGPWGECEDGFAKVLSSLDFMSRSLEEASQQYQEREASNTSAIEQAGSGGGLNLDY